MIGFLIANTSNPVYNWPIFKATTFLLVLDAIHFLTKFSKNKVRPVIKNQFEIENKSNILIGNKNPEKNAKWEKYQNT